MWGGLLPRVGLRFQEKIKSFIRPSKLLKTFKSNKYYRKSFVYKVLVNFRSCSSESCTVEVGVELCDWLRLSIVHCYSAPLIGEDESRQNIVPGRQDRSDLRSSGRQNLSNLNDRNCRICSEQSREAHWQYQLHLVCHHICQKSYLSKTNKKRNIIIELY